MHCVTDYPVEDKFANLKCIEKMKNDFKITIGYSDHTLGDLAALDAVSKGAKVIEKHFTLNKNFSGPDHKSSLEPKNFSEMVKKIRKLEILQGNGLKKIEKCEIKNSKVAKKSLVAKKLIKKNDLFNYSNLTAKRPNNGMNPLMIKKIINRKSKKKFQPDELIKI